MMSAKMAAPGLLKIMDDVTNKILSRDSNYIVDVFMWPEFGNCGFSMREVITISILKGFDQENHFFERWSWFKFNNLGLPLGSNLRFYTSMEKRWKLKVINFLGLIPTFVEVTGEKGKNWLGGLPPPPPPPPPILNRINIYILARFAMWFGVYSSLNQKYHHPIVFAKYNLKLSYPPPHEYEV